MVGGVLDDCFRQLLVALKDDRPHETIEAFLRLVDKKICFTPEATFYQEPAGG